MHLKRLCCVAGVFAHKFLLSCASPHSSMLSRHSSSSSILNALMPPTLCVYAVHPHNVMIGDWPMGDGGAGASSANGSSSDGNSRPANAPQPSRFTFPLGCIAPGRARVTLRFSDGSLHTTHFTVLDALPDHLARFSDFQATSAWLPRDSLDPFGRWIEPVACAGGNCGLEALRACAAGLWHS